MITAPMVARLQAASNGSWDQTWAILARDSEWAGTLAALQQQGVDLVQMVLDFRRRYGHPENAANVAKYMTVYNAKLPAAPGTAPASATNVTLGTAIKTMQTVINQGTPTPPLSAPTSAPSTSGGQIVNTLWNLISGQTKTPTNPNAPATTMPSVFNTPEQNRTLAGGTSSAPLAISDGARQLLTVGAVGFIVWVVFFK